MQNIFLILLCLFIILYLYSSIDLNQSFDEQIYSYVVWKIIIMVILTSVIVYIIVHNILPEYKNNRKIIL